MAVLFGSELVAEAVYGVLAGLPAVTAATGDRIVNLSVAGDLALPAALHYMDNGDYGGPIGQAATSERVRYVVRLVCEGASTDPIRAAAEAAFAAFDGFEATPAPGAWLGSQVVGEWPLTTVLEGGVLYRQLGFYLSVDLTQGG